MLGLLTPTDRTWVRAAEVDLAGLLADHAHCEIKAAQSALSLVARFAQEAPEIVAPLIALAHEETEHFAQVNDRLSVREARLSLPSRDDYVMLLRKASQVRGEKSHALMDRLLVSALVEARSCERFKLLSEELQDESLRDFYRDLMVSEARHFRLFCKLSEDRFGKDETRERLVVLAEREAEIAKFLPLGPTIHG